MAANPIAIEPEPMQSAPKRIDSVDLYRGLIMAIMALDHTRDFFTHLRFSPEDLSQTYGALFFTRWITHLCAPAFFFLAGTGMFLALSDIQAGTGNLPRYLDAVSERVGRRKNPRRKPLPRRGDGGNALFSLLPQPHSPP